MELTVLTLDAFYHQGNRWKATAFSTSIHAFNGCKQHALLSSVENV